MKKISILVLLLTVIATAAFGENAHPHGLDHEYAEFRAL